MKAVILSVRPQWCKKICNGEKTIEVRKSAPKEVPFKAYIYCTKDRKNLLPIEHGKVLEKVNFWENTDAYYGFGRVIGEFICDKVDEYTFSHYEAEYRVTHVEQKAMCLNQPELIRYGKGKTLYGWHISDLKIYDKPKELNEFFTIADESDCCCGCVWHETPLFEMPCRTCTGERKYLYRPPQSYMFVEEVEEQNNNDN